ncbi:MAG TPA: ABC transporter permease [Gemmatimonadaceae bacterium]|nr:ABC transporter permease [Gemmatimonadaceae bacterium]
MLADLRYAWRTIRRSPGFALAVVLTLALGIGANSAIFSVVHGVLLRPLPFGQPDQLVRIYGRYPEFGRTSTSLPDFQDWRVQSHSFQQMAARYNGAFVLTGEGEPERVIADRVTANFLTTFGVRPAIGRGFLPEEEQVGGDDRVVILDYGYWQRRFAGDERIVGRQIQLSGQPYLVVGIAPKDFRIARDVDLYAPARADTTMPRRAEFMDVYARLKPGVSVQQADADVAAVNRRLAEEYPATNTTIRSEVIGLQNDMVRGVRPALLAFMGAVALVLLIACANVANLLLARAASRDREVAVRVALGAGRGRLMRQLLTESVVLALIGGALGLGMATWGVAAVRGLDVQFLPRQGEITIDGTIVAFTVMLSVVTGLLFGLAPALRLSRGSLHATLREGARGATGGSLARVRGALVLGEVAVALMLLVGAGLLIRSFDKLTKVNLGFDPSQVLTWSVTFPVARFSDRDQAGALYPSLLERAKSLPGVQHAALSADLPMDGASYLSFSIQGRPDRPSRPGAAPEDMQPFAVSPDYFATMHIPLKRGRLITAEDRAGTTPVAVISEEAVRRFFDDGRDPIGSRITFGNPGNPNTTWMTIVGVVGNIAQEGVTAKPYAQLYQSIDQAPTRVVYVSLRGDRDPMLLASSVRGAVRSVSPDLLVNDIQTLEDRVSRNIARPRLSVLLLGGFSAIALLLAAIGIYGVMAYTVAQRTREIGVRMALGADPHEVKQLVVRQGMRPALIGVAVGLVAAFAATRLIASLLYGVSAVDPVTFVLVPLFLIAVALLATYLPARRATRVPPTVALQTE